MSSDEDEHTSPVVPKDYDDRNSSISSDLEVIIQKSHSQFVIALLHQSPLIDHCTVLVLRTLFLKKINKMKSKVEQQ